MISRIAFIIFVTIFLAQSKNILAQKYYKESSQNIIRTNSVTIRNAPSWLTQSRVQSVVDHVERKLEWSIRRVNATYYKNAKQMIKNFNGRAAPEIVAFTKRADNSIHFGPKVNKSNFDLYFGHELAHVVIFQKYKKSIPPWLNEGLCNSVAGYKKVKFDWLSKQRPRIDITKLHHPYEISNKGRADLHYAASLAAVKMLEKKCPSFRELLNLSLRSNVNDYIKTYCKIKDVNATFWSWIDRQAWSKRPKSY